MKRLFMSLAVGTAFVIGASIPCYGHDLPGVAIALECVMYLIGYALMDVYGRNYLKWKNDEQRSIKY